MAGGKEKVGTHFVTGSGSGSGALCPLAQQMTNTRSLNWKKNVCCLMLPSGMVANCEGLVAGLRSATAKSDQLVALKQASRRLPRVPFPRNPAQALPVDELSSLPAPPQIKNQLIGHRKKKREFLSGEDPREGGKTRLQLSPCWQGCGHRQGPQHTLPGCSLRAQRAFPGEPGTCNKEGLQLDCLQLERCLWWCPCCKEGRMRWWCRPPAVGALGCCVGEQPMATSSLHVSCFLTAFTCERGGEDGQRLPAWPQGFVSICTLMRHHAYMQPWAALQWTRRQPRSWPGRTWGPCPSCSAPWALQTPRWGWQGLLGAQAVCLDDPRSRMEASSMARAVLAGTSPCTSSQILR